MNAREKCGIFEMSTSCLLDASRTQDVISTDAVLLLPDQALAPGIRGHRHAYLVPQKENTEVIAFASKIPARQFWFDDREYEMRKGHMFCRR